MAHMPPKTAVAGRPLVLYLQIGAPAAASVVRLHYRPLNQLAGFRTVEQPAAKTTFTIPPEDVTQKWDLQYYFEILNREGGGWFQPDPAQATPYYVVTTQPQPAASPGAETP
jgi:hypothetical protein